MLTIRKLHPEDGLDSVLALCKDFFAEYEDFHKEFFDTDNLGDDVISGRFLESLESDSSATIIALDNDVIVGYASIVIREQPRFYKIKKVGAISALMVTKEHRRKGIATMLLAESKAFFKRHGIKYFTLYTSYTNKGAMKFYEKIGLEKIHTSFLGNTTK